jgi:flagellar hook-basal body complex protein FliE
VITPGIGIAPLGGSEWSVGGISGLGASTGSVGSVNADVSAPTGDKSFGSALTKAIGGLETTQANATQASEQLATGQLADPTQAITAVENASLSMDFASQIRNQIDTAAASLFQTQV